MQEVEAIYEKNYGKPPAIFNVQLGRISHENDTEDISTDVDPVAYNPAHSKKWNKEVDNQAIAIENQMKIEENTRISEERARERAAQLEAERKAEAKREAEEKARQAKKEVKKVEQKKSRQTVDFAELYKNVDEKDVTMLQTSGDYEKHTEYYNSLVEAKEKEIADEMEKDQKEENQKKLEEAIAHAQAEDKPIIAPTQERRHINPSVDLNEMYEGVKLVQLNSQFTHETDPDDIVPDNAQVYQEKKEEEKPDDTIKVDFSGAKFTEDY